MKEYKPIVIVYIDHTQFSGDNKMFKEAFTKAGYEHVLMFGIAGIEPRVEIISVDKATIVEDIQKYIDLQSIKEK